MDKEHEAIKVGTIEEESVAIALLFNRLEGLIYKMQKHLDNAKSSLKGVDRFGNSIWKNYQGGADLSTIAFNICTINYALKGCIKDEIMNHVLD